MPPTERMFVRMAASDRELIAYLRRRWGIGDDSETLRVAVRRAAERERLGTPAPLGEAAADGRGWRETAAPTIALPDGLAVDLVEAARRGTLDPVVGRERETARVLQILTRLTGRNVLLVGERGVGKTALVEGLAARLASGDVPETLRDRRLLAIDCAVLTLAGRFGAPDHVLAQVNEVVAQGRAGAILFLNRAHALAGTPDSAAPALLRLALLQGQVQFIGETTPDQYQERLQRDECFGRTSVVRVEPSTAAETVAVLRALRADLERHHGLSIADDAVEAAARLAGTAAAGTALPAAAVDLLDEVAGRACLLGEDTLTSEAVAGLASSRPAS